jgi:hypothetical protein
MNRATEIAMDFMLGQIYDLSLVTTKSGECQRDKWDIKHVKEYYQNAVEDWSEEYDQDYYTTFYIDKRSPCIDWKAIADALQDERDDLFLQYAFE